MTSAIFLLIFTVICFFAIAAGIYSVVMDFKEQHYIAASIFTSATIVTITYFVIVVSEIMRG